MIPSLAFTGLIRNNSGLGAWIRWLPQLIPSSHDFAAYMKV
jgi:hypothetical protein